ncbi:uncharacterized protein C8A04DRAFT_24828 [Dichotomopilus funicola]|uniref:Uncharacterized protein n=1 Tax=Dichotomopilus funicola TaxID=1934379 RepID=A0AAN6VA12_9PEZI|nr:hypothetical protein C8A04DRAFT_24828 [Dichotomopilus funicola]
MTITLPPQATPTAAALVARATNGYPLLITSFPSIPLTTTFTPPDGDCGGIYLPETPRIYVVDDKPSCLPPRFSTSDASFYYSPGIACPSGYWTACHDTAGVSTITTVTCCPTIGSDISLSCVPSPQILSDMWETLYCTWIAPSGDGTQIPVTFSDNGGRTSTVLQSVASPGGVNAYGVRMVHEASDLSKSTTTSATTTSEPTTSTGAGGAGRTTNSAATDTAAVPATTDGATTSGGGGLSTGAIAAIAAVVPLVVIGAAVLGFFAWKRKRKNRQLQPEELDSQSPPHDRHHHTSYPASYPPPSSATGLHSALPQSAAPAYDYPAGAGANVHSNGPGVEPKYPDYYYYGSGGPPPTEMDGESRLAEMPSGMPAAELQGHGVGGGGWVTRR